MCRGAWGPPRTCGAIRLAIAPYVLSENGTGAPCAPFEAGGFDGARGAPGETLAGIRSRANLRGHLISGFASVKPVLPGVQSRTTYQ